MTIQEVTLGIIAVCMILLVFNAYEVSITEVEIQEIAYESFRVILFFIIFYLIGTFLGNYENNNDFLRKKILKGKDNPELELVVGLATVFLVLFISGLIAAYIVYGLI